MLVCLLCHWASLALPIGLELRRCHRWSEMAEQVSSWSWLRAQLPIKARDRGIARQRLNPPDPGKDMGKGGESDPTVS